MISTSTRPRQLISRRFQLTAGEADLPQDRQRRAFRTLINQIQTGAYKFTSAPCPCNHSSDNDVVVAEVDRYHLPLCSVLCMTCGTVRCDPYLDGPSLDSFYRTLYQDLYGRATDMNEYFDRQKAYGQKILAAVKEHNPRSVLEVGCGAGGGLSVFHDAGYFVAGCDYSDELIKFGTSKGVPNLHVGPIQEIRGQLGRDRFDYIYLHHVFEHVDQPQETLRDLAHLLAPGGRILLIVPDLSTIHRHAYPAGDALKMLHIAHKYNYTPLGLQLLARQVNLSAQIVTPPRSMATSWSHAPELWAQFTVDSACQPRSAGMHGSTMLKYLRRTEHLYRWGLCPAQLGPRLNRIAIGRWLAGGARRVKKLFNI